MAIWAENAKVQLKAVLAKILLPAPFLANKIEFREPVKLQIEFLFVRNRNHGRLSLVVQDFKYSEKAL